MIDFQQHAADDLAVSGFAPSQRQAMTIKPSPVRDDGGVIAHLRELLGPVVLLACKGKKPLRKGWQKLTVADMTPEYLTTLHGHNFGVSLGTASAGLVSVDFDTDEALAAFLAVNPDLADTLRTRGRRGGNLWFRVLGTVPKSSKLNDASRVAVGEWRADGNQTIIHGIHPDTKQPYEMVRRVAPMVLSIASIQWPAEAKPQKWPSANAAKGDTCDVECVEHTDSTEHTDNSAVVLQHCTSTLLHHTAKPAPGLSAVVADKAFRANHSVGVVKLYEKLVEIRYKPEPHARNAFITQAVPFLYRAVSKPLVLLFSQHFYASNQALFHDTAADHERETRAMLDVVESSYLDELEGTERELYTALAEPLQAVFRICRDLALRDEAGGPPPPLFFMSAQGLADRMKDHCQQAHRWLNALVRYSALKVETRGTAHSHGHRGEATVYRWLLPVTSANEGRS